MSDNLSNFKELRLKFKETYENLIGEEREFPKYTTQLINIANQNAQGTRPKVVGKMSELIKKCPQKSYKGWKNWYLENHPKAIEKATNKIWKMILKMKEAMKKIDINMVKEWVKDLVIDKTAEGLIIQEIILKKLAELKGTEYKEATPKQESRNIDGFLGDIPIQIKSITYRSKKSSVREEITIPTIYYKKTQKYLYIYFKEDLFHKNR
jgi:hypothetical protein